METDLTRLRFIAANYCRLQGLRAVPVGAYLLLITLWAAFRPGDLSLTLPVTLLCALAYWIIDRYYTKSFGKVSHGIKSGLIEAAVSIGFGLLTLLAFVAETSLKLPFSPVGLAIAGALLTDYLLASRSAGAKTLRYYPENVVSAAIIFLMSLLPLSGWEWWLAFGIRSSLLALLIFIGMIMIASGALGHFRFIRSIAASGTESHE
jgi:hypothetical protein